MNLNLELGIYYIEWFVIFLVGWCISWELLGRTIIYYQRHPRFAKWLKIIGVPLLFILVFLSIYFYGGILAMIIPDPSDPLTPYELTQNYALLHSFLITGLIMVLIHWKDIKKNWQELEELRKEL